MENKSKPTIGLFGTCGSSKWRDPFIAEYEARGMVYFNPLKANWTPDDAVEEAKHLQSDDILLFPVTGETYGSASLAELALAALSAETSDTPRYVIAYINPKADDSLQSLPTSYKESNNARAIVLAHLRRMSEWHIPPTTSFKSLYLARSMEEMLSLSTKLYAVALAQKQFEATLGR